MTTERLARESFEELVRRYVEEVWNDGNYDLLEMMPEGIEVADEGGRTSHERERRDTEALRTAFPDFHMTIEDLWFDEDVQVGFVHYTTTGTFENEWVVDRKNGDSLRFEPTGRSFSFPGVAIYRFKDGRPVEIWGGYKNWLDWFEQAGIIPDMAEFAAEAERADPERAD